MRQMVEEGFMFKCAGQGYSGEDRQKFSSALALAKTFLGQKKRLAGDTYFDRNVRVAEFLIDQKADPSSILASILHGTLPEAEQEITTRFGKDLWSLLSGIAELKTIKTKNKQLTADALRKVILATITDIRIIQVALAVKLENMRRLDVFPEEEQRALAREVLDFYAPLAYRLGMDRMRVQLEDLSFQVVQPEKYQEIAIFLQESREEREGIIAEAIDAVKKVAGDLTILKIKGRPKHIYSIYKKMAVRNVPLPEQFDLLGIRVLVPEIKDSYTLLGILHEQFTPIEGKLKDYIAHPKPNFYRALHTTLLFPGKKTVEVQIVTPEMEEWNEGGLAAHWRYKGLKSEQEFEKKLSWLKSILELQKESSLSEFLETVKVDLFGDKIHCYTPKGAVKELPVGATLLDFAYAVHEEVGNTAVGGRVNGVFVSLKHLLTMGDVVEILTHKHQRPRRSWLKIVRSGKTRQKIRKSLRDVEKLPPMLYRSLKPAVEEERGLMAEAPEFTKALCLLAKCCLPLPGQEIVGLPTKRRVISVHRQECRRAGKEENRWIVVRWKESFRQMLHFFVVGAERSGFLADVLHTLATAGFVVKEAKAKMINQGIVECSFQLVPQDLSALQEMLSRVQKVKGIQKMYFG